jgi:hypothetical protein
MNTYIFRESMCLFFMTTATTMNLASAQTRHRPGRVYPFACMRLFSHQRCSPSTYSLKTVLIITCLFYYLLWLRFQLLQLIFLHIVLTCLCILVQGRILVFAVEDGRLQLIVEKETKGAVYSLNAFNGKLLAAINQKIQLYKWMTREDGSHVLVTF